MDPLRREYTHALTLTGVWDAGHRSVPHPRAVFWLEDLRTRTRHPYRIRGYAEFFPFPRGHARPRGLLGRIAPNEILQDRYCHLTLLVGLADRHDPARLLLRDIGTLGPRDGWSRPPTVLTVGDTVLLPTRPIEGPGAPTEGPGLCGRPPGRQP